MGTCSFFAFRLKPPFSEWRQTILTELHSLKVYPFSVSCKDYKKSNKKFMYWVEKKKKKKKKKKKTRSVSIFIVLRKLKMLNFAGKIWQFNTALRTDYLKALYSTKIDIFVQERFNKLIYGMNTIIKYGTWQPVKFQLVSHSWTGSKQWNDFYCISELMLATLIQRYHKKSFNFSWIIKCLFFRNMEPLTRRRLEIPKRVTGKQCRPRSDAAKRGVWSGSPLFASSSTIFSLGISTSYSLTYLKSEMDSSKI